MTNKLVQSSALVQQLKRESETLGARVSSLEGQLSQEQDERQSEVGRAEEHLNKMTGALESALAELEGTQTTNLLLQQKVGGA